MLTKNGSQFTSNRVDFCISIHIHERKKCKWGVSALTSKKDQYTLRRNAIMIVPSPNTIATTPRSITGSLRSITESLSTIAKTASAIPNSENIVLELERSDQEPENPELDVEDPELQLNGPEQETMNPRNRVNALSHTTETTSRSAHGAQSASELRVFFLYLFLMSASPSSREYKGGRLTSNCVLVASA
jgi:hypothetical protein